MHTDQPAQPAAASAAEVMCVSSGCAVSCGELGGADQCPQPAGQRRDACGGEFSFIPWTYRDNMPTPEPRENAAQARAEVGVLQSQR
jgi:hypothetical protein